MVSFKCIDFVLFLNEKGTQTMNEKDRNNKPFDAEIERRIIKAEMQEFGLLADDSTEITNVNEQLDDLW
ncbi:hypothetical protein C6P12_06975 [Weissella confusa]|nr:hypothetical protein C6P12_06975 [Weissella confusa]